MQLPSIVDAVAGARSKSHNHEANKRSQDPISVLKRLAGAALVPSLGIVVAFGSDVSRFSAPIFDQKV